MKARPGKPEKTKAIDFVTLKMAALLEAGWRLTPEGEKLCGNSAKAALDLDLRDIGAEWLPDDINRGKSTVLEGGCILQVCFSHIFIPLNPNL